MCEEKLSLLQRFLIELSNGDIALWISVITFVMSAASWIRVFLVERRRLRFTVQLFKAREHTAYMVLMIENKSRMPIAISRISLKLNGKLADCTPFPAKVIGTKSADVETSTYSAKIPIQLDGLSSTSCIVLFEDIPSEIPSLSTHLNFEVLTNRGRTVKKTLQLPQGWASREYIP